jgi:large subunit ribosomal protein L30
MIVAVRIAGRVGMTPKEGGVLFNLRLRKKYSCVLIKDKDKSLLDVIKNKIAFGEIEKDTLVLLLSKRGRRIGNKPISESSDIIAKKIEEGKSLDELKIKPFFRLQPPVKGFRKSTKLLYPKGVLGENKDINDLVRRML